MARLLRRTSLITDAALVQELSGHSYDEALAHVIDDPVEVGTPPREEKQDIIRWWVERMAAPGSGLYERMVWFWHTHLTTSHHDVSSGVLVGRQLELLRTHALGNFRDLLQGFVIDGALLQYLDGDGSEASNPNENLSRELMELFTVGLGNYSEDDVRSGARALAGWRVDRDDDEVTWDRTRAFVAPLLFRGRQDNFDTAMVVDHLCDDPATAAYVSNKLWSHLAGGWLDGNDALELGQWWQDHDLEIRPLVERILTDKGFEDTYYSRPRSGIEFYCSLRSTLGVSLDEDWHLRSLGQVPFEPPNVAGWPTDNRWLEPGSLLNRGSLLFNVDFDDVYEPMPGTVDHVLDRCGLHTVSQSTLDSLNKIGLRSDLDERQRAEARWRLTLSSPEFHLT